MANYNKLDECVGCGAHISEYHLKPCVYDPEFEQTFTCQLCGEDGKDLYAGAIVQPWGDTCRECINEIKGKVSNA